MGAKAPVKFHVKHGAASGYRLDPAKMHAMKERMAEADEQHRIKQAKKNLFMKGFVMDDFTGYLRRLTRGS